MLGEVVSLFGNSRLHLGYTVADIATYVLAPMRLKQYMIFRTKKGPVAYIAWAYLSDQVAALYEAGEREIQPDDWKGGSQLWFVEFVAPYGHAQRIIDELRRSIFAKAHARALHRRPNMPARRVDWYGIDYRPAQAGDAVS